MLNFYVTLLRKQWANLKVQLDNNETLKLYWSTIRDKTVEFYGVVVEKSGPVLTSTYELGQVYFTKALEATQGF